MCFLAVWIVQAIILARAILPRGQAEGLSSFTLTSVLDTGVRVKSTNTYICQL